MLWIGYRHLTSPPWFDLQNSPAKPFYKQTFFKGPSARERQHGDLNPGPLTPQHLIPQPTWECRAKCWSPWGGGGSLLEDQPCPWLTPPRGMLGTSGDDRKTVVWKAEDLCDSPGFLITLNFLWKKPRMASPPCPCCQHQRSGCWGGQFSTDGPLLCLQGMEEAAAPGGDSSPAQPRLQSCCGPAGFKSGPQWCDLWQHLTPYPATGEQLLLGLSDPRVPGDCCLLSLNTTCRVWKRSQAKLQAPGVRRKAGLWARGQASHSQDQNSLPSELFAV